MEEERDLIFKARSGDRSAYEQLVNEHQGRVFAAAYRLLRNYEDAAELAQDAFIAAYQAIKGFRLQSSFYTWIYRIVLNLCYHKLRSAKYKAGLKTRALEESFASKSPSASDVLISKEREESLRRALASLKEPFYQVIVLHDLEGLSYKEIAAIVNCSIGTVMSRLHRARLQLSEKLKKVE